MPAAKIVIYNLEPYAPGEDTPDSSNKIQYKSLVRLMSELSLDGANKLNSALVSTARYVIDTCSKPSYNYDNEILSIFVDGNTKTLSNKSKSYLYKLVERVVTDDPENDYKVIRSWVIDSDLLKATLLREILSRSLIKYDYDKLIGHYKLKEYLPKIYCGMINDTEYVDYAKRYNKYLFEFYKRSSEPDQQKLDEYSDRCTCGNMPSIYDMRSVGTVVPFQFSINMSHSVIQSESNIDEHCKDLKFIINRLYEVNYSEDGYKSTTGGGNSHYTKQFAKWDRYLRIFDLYQEYKEVKNPQLDAIGRKIVNEFNVFKESSLTDRRKEVLKGYKEAQRLIELSAEGRLS